MTPLSMELENKLDKVFIEDGDYKSKLIKVKEAVKKGGVAGAEEVTVHGKEKMAEDDTNKILTAVKGRRMGENTRLVSEMQKSASPRVSPQSSRAE